MVRGVSLAKLDSASFRRIEEAFLEHAVLVFPDQHGLTKEEQSAFASRFGKLEYPTGPVANHRPDGSVLQQTDHDYKTARLNEAWHTDSTYMPISSKVGLLHAEGSTSTGAGRPTWGGETEYADLRAAYDALGEEMKARLSGLAAYHSVHYSYAISNNGGYFPKKGTSYGLHGKAFLRPLVKTHPGTGRKNLFVASHAFQIKGMSSEESKALVQDLTAFATQPERTYTHAWTPGDVVIWDNRCCLHRSRPYDATEKRTLRGSRVAGEPETEAALDAPEAQEVLDKELARLRDLYGFPPESEEEARAEVSLVLQVMPEASGRD